MVQRREFVGAAAAAATTGVAAERVPEIPRNALKESLNEAS